MQHIPSCALQTRSVRSISVNFTSLGPFFISFEQVVDPFSSMFFSHKDFLFLNRGGNHSLRHLAPKPRRTCRRHCAFLSHRGLEQTFVGQSWVNLSERPRRSLKKWNIRTSSIAALCALCTHHANGHCIPAEAVHLKTLSYMVLLEEAP